MLPFQCLGFQSQCRNSFVSFFFLLICVVFFRLVATIILPIDHFKKISFYLFFFIFISYLGTQGSSIILIPDISFIKRVILGISPGFNTKDSKTVLYASLLNTQHYKVQIERKVGKYRERSSAFPYILV